MSVLIKDISMPKEPWDCPCHDGETGRCKVTASSCFPIPKDCPLVEVSTSHETEGRTMSDLISRQNAIDACINMCKHYTPIKSVKHPHIDFVVETLKELPSAQKKGEWIRDEEQSKKHIEPIFICSVCHDFSAWGEDEKYNYCPNCGADMRGEINE